MRYTTIIDITEMPDIYHNVNCRLIYLHLVLKSGYHDNDRDIIRTSLRRIAADTGVTISAARHAISSMERSGLLKRQGDVWIIRKWIAEQPITTRAKTQRQQRAIEAAAQRDQEAAARAQEMEVARIRRESQWAAGKNSFMIWYENELAKADAGDLEAAKTIERHRNTYEKMKAKMDAEKVGGKV